MKLEEAKVKLLPFVNIKFSELMKEYNIDDIIVNKGKTGQLLEILLGMKNTNATLDFEDGELKTNKCRADSHPLETMFITQVMSMVDELLEKKPFETTRLYKKIDNILYVPICKVGKPEDWFVLPIKHLDLRLPKFAEFKNQFKSDYITICDKMISDIAARGDIHTSSGKYIQIRTKDSKPYSPIFSAKYNKLISNKNFAFYFKKDFMIDVVKIK